MTDIQRAVIEQLGPLMAELGFTQAHFHGHDGTPMATPYELAINGRTGCNTFYASLRVTGSGDVNYISCRDDGTTVTGLCEVGRPDFFEHMTGLLRAHDRTSSST